MPFEKGQITFFVTTPVAFEETPSFKLSDKKVKLGAAVKQVSSIDANKLQMEIELSFECPSENQFGVPVVNMTLEFEGCPIYIATFMKSCGRDAVRKSISLITVSSNARADNN
jgi:hypothetical protein